MNAKKLRLLADWIDLKHPDCGSDEVQCDLRAFADEIELGCLRIVPDGEPFCNDKMFDGVYLTKSGIVFVGEGQYAELTKDALIPKGEIVQPVKLEVVE